MSASPAKSLKSRFLVGVSSTTLATLIPQVISFVGILLVLRWVAQDAFGVYALLIVTVQLFVMIAELGIGTSAIRNLQAVEDESEKRVLLSTVILGTMLMSLAGGILATVGRPWILQAYDYELLGRFLWYVIPLIFLTSVNGIVLRSLQALYAYRVFFILSIVTSISRFLLVVLFVKVLDQGVIGIIFADLISGSLALVVAWVSFPLKLSAVIDAKVLRRILAFGFPLYLNALLSYLFNRVDILMIGNMTDATYVAAVDVAKRIPNNLNLLLSSSFMTVFFPNISALLTQGDPRRASRLTNKSLRVMPFLLAILAVVISNFQDEIVVALFSDKYLFAGPAFTLFMWSLAVGMASNIMGTTLVAAGHTRVPVQVNIIVVVLNILLNLVLIPRHGFVGAAMATLIVSLVALPMNQAFLHARVFRVEMSYAIPLVFGMGIWLLLVWAGIHSIWLRSLLVLAFPVAMLYFLRPLRDDVKDLLGHGLSKLLRPSER